MQNWIAFALISSLGWAIFHAAVKGYSQQINPFAINAIASLGAIIFSSICIWMSPVGSLPKLNVGFWVLLMAGVAIGLADWSIAKAYASGGGIWQVSVVSTCIFLSITAMIGILGFGENVTLAKALGFGLALVSVWLMN